MAKTLFTKNDIASYQENNGDATKIEKAKEEFKQKTNINPVAVFHKSFLSTLKGTKDAFLLENIKPTSDTSGDVKCDNAFHQLMEKRKEKSLSQRIKNHGHWDADNWWLLIGVVLIMIALFCFKGKTDQYNDESNQLERAKVLASSGTWTSREAIVDGPLHINLNDWKAAVDNKNVRDSLSQLKDSLTTQGSEYSDKQRSYSRYKMTTLEQRKRAIYDSIRNKMQTIAQAILLKARDSIKNNKTSPDYFVSEQTKAALLLKSVDSLGKFATIDIQHSLDSLNAIVAQPVVITNTEIANRIKQIESQMPKEITYTYDLLGDPSTETDDGWKFAFWAFMIIGGILFGIFIIFVIILFVNLPPVEGEKIHYYADTLRAMAFPGKRSSTNSNYSCNISFTMSPETTKLLQSVLIRYQWNVLSHADAFEFNEILKNSEPLPSATKQGAPEPLFFVYEGDMIIVYAGVGEDEVVKDNLLQPVTTDHEISLKEKDRTM